MYVCVCVWRGQINIFEKETKINCINLLYQTVNVVKISNSRAHMLLISCSKKMFYLSTTNFWCDVNEIVRFCCLCGMFFFSLSYKWCRFDMLITLIDLWLLIISIQFVFLFSFPMKDTISAYKKQQSMQSAPFFYKQPPIQSH